jgi:hypothetical protein
MRLELLSCWTFLFQSRRLLAAAAVVNSEFTITVTYSQEMLLGNTLYFNI